MAQLKDKEMEVQRLMVLGAMSLMKQEEQDKILSIKGKLKEVCDESGQKDFAQVAIALLMFELQKEE